MLDQLSLTDFDTLLHVPLDFRAADGAFQLELQEARLLQQPSPRPTPPFRLLFKSSEGRRLPQGNFELQHPVHGPLVMFMVPVQPDGAGSSYEVIFN